MENSRKGRSRQIELSGRRIRDHGLDTAGNELVRIGDNQRQLARNYGLGLEYRANGAFCQVIDRDDFDTVPVLSNRGGWGRANRVFDGDLADFLEELNRELVAA